MFRHQPVAGPAPDPVPNQEVPNRLTLDPKVATSSLDRCWAAVRAAGKADRVPPRDEWVPLFTEVLVIRQTLLALAVVAFLGYALNDSGLAIPAMMAVVFECALVYVVLIPAGDPVADPLVSPLDAPGAPAVDDPQDAPVPQLV